MESEITRVVKKEATLRLSDIQKRNPNLSRRRIKQFIKLGIIRPIYYETGKMKRDGK